MRHRSTLWQEALPGLFMKEEGKGRIAESLSLANGR